MPDINIMDSFSEFIKEKRKALGWSQDKLAKEANLMRSLISDIETGKRTSVTTDTINSILKAMKSDIEGFKEY